MSGAKDNYLVCDETLGTMGAEHDRLGPQEMMITRESLQAMNPDVVRHLIPFIVVPDKYRQLLVLRELNQIFSEEIDYFLSKRKTISYIGFADPNGGYCNIEYDKFTAVISLFPNAKSLRLKNIKVDEELAHISASKLPLITELNLSNCENISSSLAFEITRYFPQLKIMKISSSNITEQTLAILVRNLPSLEVLDALNPGYNVTGLALANLGINIRHLCFSITSHANKNAVIDAIISSNCRNLQTLGLQFPNYHSTSWDLFVNGFQNLKNLRLQFSSNASDTLVHFADLPLLENLFLAEYSYNKKVSIMNDENVIALLTRIPNIKVLALVGGLAETLRFTDRAIVRLSTVCPILKDLTLMRANHISDEGLRILALNLKNLKKVTLIYLENINDLGIAHIASNTKSINELRIKDCSNITENVIVDWSVAAKTRRQEWIHLQLEGIKVTMDLIEMAQNLKISK